VHYCRAGDDSTLSPFRFIELLATALADRYPTFAKELARDATPETVITAETHVGTATESEIRNLTINSLVLGERSARIAYDRAVRQPLKALRAAGTTQQIRIIVDALDEALTFDRREHLVELLQHALGTAGRPTENLQFLFTARSGEDRVLGRINADQVDLVTDATNDDVAEYIQTQAAIRFAEIPRELMARIVGAITEASDGNFLYAHHALAELDLNADLSSLPTGLGGLYAAFIQRELRRDSLDDLWLRSHRPVLAMLAVARGPGLTADQIAGATGLSVAEVARTLGMCGQYLRIARSGAPADFYHPSFREFLLSRTELGIVDERASRRLAESLMREYYTDPADRGNWYAIEYLFRHLVDALVSEQLPSQREECRNRLRTLASDAEFLERKAARFGVDSILADLLPAVLDDPSLRVVADAADRVAGQVRGWVAEAEPALFAQQLLDVARRVGADSLASAAHRRLTELSQRYFVRRWDSGDDPPELVRLLMAHEFGVDALAALDGNRVASGSYDGTVRIWDHTNGLALRTIPLYGDRPPSPHWTVPTVLSLAATPDGRLVAGLDNGELSLLDPDSGRVDAHYRTSTGTPPSVGPVITSGDGVLFSGGHDTKVRAWRMDAPESELSIYNGHDQPVSALCLGANGRVISGDESGLVHSWNPGGDPDSRCVAQLHSTVRAVAASGGLIAIGSDDGNIHLLADGFSGTGQVLRGHHGPIRALAFLGDRLASASDDRSVRLWDKASGECTRVLTGHQGAVQALIALGDGRLASADSQDLVYIWDLTRHSAEEVREPFGMTNALSVAGNQLLSAFEDGTVRVWELDTGQLDVSLSGHQGPCCGVAAGPEGYWVSAGQDGTLHLWVGTPKSAERVIGPLDGVITHLIAAPDGRILSGSDRGVRITDVLTGETEHVLSGSGFGLSALAVNANGWVVAGEDRGRHFLVNIFTGRKQFVRPGHDGFFNATVLNAALTADDRLISDGGTFHDSEYLLWMWEIESGEPLGTIKGHASPVHAMALDSLGRLWTGSRDRSVRVIDINERTVLARFRLDGMPRSIAPLADGSGVVVGDISGRLSRWDFLDH
jgi:WD40 repeat protein